MIIQCKECGTEYRFDKSQIVGEGVWVRCSRCEAIFFQKNPLAEISSLMHLMEPEGEPRAKIEGEETKERGSALGETETGGASQGSTWEDAYPDAGDDIETERIEVEEARVVEETEAGDAIQGPAWEGDALDAGEGIEIERVEVEEEEARIVGGDEAGDAVQDPAWEGDSPDTGEYMEMERVDEEETRVVEGDEAEDAVQGPAWEGDSSDAGDGIAGEGTGEEGYRAVDESEAGYTVQGDRWKETSGNVGEIAGGDKTQRRQRVREPWTFGDTDEVIYNERVTAKRGRGGMWPLIKKIVLYLVLVALLSGGVYLWLAPEAREMISDRAFPQAKKFLGITDSKEIEGAKETVLPKVEEVLEVEDKGVQKEGLPELKVTLVDVGERFVKGWTAENVMVVEGSAVNDNALAVSKIRVRGKLLDSSGTVLSEEESNCGTILTDDELKSLTRDEIKQELSNPYGRDFRNADIQPGDRVPFMLVFTMPAEDASELVVELMDIEAAENK